MVGQRQQATNAGRTNETRDSVVRVISAPATTSWIRPNDNVVFNMNVDASLPDIVFEFRTDEPGPYQWAWSIKWDAKASGLKERARRGAVLRSFSKDGSFTSTQKKWNAEFGGDIIGGELKVKVIAGHITLEKTVTIKGANPALEDVTTFVNAQDGLSGFDKILEQETAAKHFINFDSEPITSFDQGYGITQMTNPTPTYTQVWSWKENILGGASLYRQKRREAENYLGAQGRTYTEEQLQHETFSRWNGGSYHVWDEPQHQWARRNNILCDTQTGNIGWDTTNPANANRTEDELHNRDQGQYPDGTHGQNNEHPWRYTGVCYADHILGE
ncbi:hypothetical protein ACHHY8_24570 [Enterobacter cloacae complex sp. 2024EL-00215]|uniref:hypothetical protein n=1 Tax=unclassified Enterobacter cloacae complex TaxID=2757714 RepID=UPI0037515476